MSLCCKFYLLGIAIFAVAAVHIGTVQGGLPEKYDAWTAVYLSYAKGDYVEAENQLNLAQDKSRKVGPQYDNTSVKLVNLYTQESSEDKLRIYERVNSFLRKPSAENETVWGPFAEMLATAIDVLCPKSGCTHNVYRGRCYDCDIENDPITFQAFSSTSTDPDVALKFAQGDVFLEILKARGLAVEKFSDHPEENEILLKNCYVTRVNNKTSGSEEVKKELRRVNAKDIDSNPIPKLFLSLTSITSCKTDVSSASSYTGKEGVSLQILGLMLLIAAFLSGRKQ